MSWQVKMGGPVSDVRVHYWRGIRFGEKKVMNWIISSDV
jgi:hypothetical protein